MGNSYLTNLQCVILVQKKVITLIHDVRRWNHTNNLFYNYRILKSNDIVELKTILFMFDTYHKVLPNNRQRVLLKLCPHILHVEHINL